MKLIRVSTEMEISIHDFPEGGYSEQNNELKRLIGNGCNYYQIVYPRRLYTVLGHSNRATKYPGMAVSMLVDEEGLLKKPLVLNPLASYLYEMDKHGCPIAGNVLFVGEADIKGDIEFCGVNDTVLMRLQEQLESMANYFKTPKPDSTRNRTPEHRTPKI